MKLSKKKQAEIKAKIRDVKAKEKAAERKKDTRKKIILGGAALALYRKKTSFTDKDLLAYLDKTLKRGNERALFGLGKQREKENSENVSPAPEKPSE